MINLIIKFLGLNNAWHVNPYTIDKDAYYIDSLQDKEYLHDKLHYGAVAIKVDLGE